MSDHRMWVYHETEEPKIINSKEFKSLQKDGWSDTPATFVKFEDFGIDKDKLEDGDPNEAAKVDQLGAAIEGVNDCINGELNLDLMDKNELEEYALKHYGVDLDKRKSKANLVKQILELKNGDSE